MVDNVETQKATGRAKCRICGKPIIKNSKEMLFWSGQGQEKSHAHLQCMKDWVVQQMRIR